MAGRRKSRKTGIGIMAVVALLICGLLIYKTAVLEKKLNTKSDELDVINENIEEASFENDEINARIKYQQTDDYIEELGRELGLVYPDEIIFVPSDEKDKEDYKDSKGQEDSEKEDSGGGIEE